MPISAACQRYVSKERQKDNIIPTCKTVSGDAKEGSQQLEVINMESESCLPCKQQIQHLPWSMQLLTQGKLVQN